MKRGFTLLEILIVFSIIAVILAVSTGALLSVRKTSRDAKRKTDLEQIRGALELYKTDKGSYPAGSGDTNSVLTILVSPTPYLSKLPTDPASNTYYYEYKTSGGYALCAVLETSSSSVYTCTGASQCTLKCNYEVVNP